MFGTFGFTELLLILIIVMIIFGAGKLPQLGEGLGKAIKGFKKSVQETDAIEAEAQPTVTPSPMNSGQTSEQPASTSQAFQQAAPVSDATPSGTPQSEAIPSAKA